MPVSGRYGNPAPSSPPMPVPERISPMDVAQLFPDSPRIGMVRKPPPSAEELRASMQARADELRTQIAGMQAAQDELALIERMLEVK